MLNGKSVQKRPDLCGRMCEMREYDDEADVNLPVCVAKMEKMTVFDARLRG